MRFTCLRWLAYTLALGVPALAQPPTLISREMPHVEMSVGLGSVRKGPAPQIERELTRLGLNQRDGLLKWPQTSFMEFPPAFAQVHVGVRRHVMVGALASTFTNSTVGRDADGGLAHEQRLGWVAGGDVKIRRRPLSYAHPPTFGYLTAQYRGAPALRLPAGPLPLSGLEKRSVSWPSQRVRTSHWLIGVGIGFEI
jgi:hypothetical protein